MAFETNKITNAYHKTLGGSPGVVLVIKNKMNPLDMKDAVWINMGEAKDLGIISSKNKDLKKVIGHTLKIVYV